MSQYLIVADRIRGVLGDDVVNGTLGDLAVVVRDFDEIEQLLRYLREAEVAQVVRVLRYWRFNSWTFWAP